MKAFQTKLLALTISVFGVATAAQAAVITYNFPTSGLVNFFESNNEPTIPPVLATLSSLGLTLTTVSGLGFNVGCVPACLGADESATDDFAGHIHGVFSSTSSVLGITFVNSEAPPTVTNLYDSSSALIASFNDSFFYAGGSGAVSFFDVFLTFDGMNDITFDTKGTAVPEPSSFSLLLVSAFGLGTLKMRRGMTIRQTWGVDDVMPRGPNIAASRLAQLSGAGGKRLLRIGRTTTAITGGVAGPGGENLKS